MSNIEDLTSGNAATTVRFSNMTPQPSPFLTAEWRFLAMLNYQIDPALLLPLVPAGTELESWSGKTFVSLVGFRFTHTRLLGLALPFHRDFDEVNLRFYVRRKAPKQWRRGVVFIKEIVPRAAIAWVARRVYNENYVALPMRHDIQLPEAQAEISGLAKYEWLYREKWNGIAVEFSGAPYLPDESSEEAFITEHYWGYVRQRDGGTVEYQVEHPRWNVWRADGARLECDAAEVYGRGFAGFLNAPPSSALIADGSPVTVRRGLRIGVVG